MSQQPSDDNQNKKDLANNVLYDNMGMFKFAAIFLVLWWVLNYLYNHYFLGTPLFEHYLNLCVSLVKELLNLTGEQIDLGHLPNSMLGEIRSHDGAVVRFGEGTDGLSIMAALEAAIVAWPGSLPKKIAAVAPAGGTPQGVVGRSGCTGRRNTRDLMLRHGWRAPQRAAHGAVGAQVGARARVVHRRRLLRAVV